MSIKNSIEWTAIAFYVTKPLNFGTIYRGLISFPEMAPYLGGCKYNDCVHLHEPDCAVIPQQKESLKPFLITRTFDDKKRVETLFGYAERKQDTSQPLSVIDLQTALRSGFNYENTVRNRLDNLELLVRQLVDSSVTVADKIDEHILQCHTKHETQL